MLCELSIIMNNRSIFRELSIVKNYAEWNITTGRRYIPFGLKNHVGESVIKL
jgi:hypothetical protein